MTAAGVINTFYPVCFSDSNTSLCQTLNLCVCHDKVQWTAWTVVTKLLPKKHLSQIHHWVIFVPDLFTGLWVRNVKVQGLVQVLCMCDCRPLLHLEQLKCFCPHEGSICQEYQGQSVAKEQPGTLSRRPAAAAAADCYPPAVVASTKQH